mgnify:CR=1 FL=1
MGWVEIEEASFYGCVWLFAFLVAAFRSLTNKRGQSFRVGVGSSGVAGFLAVASVAFSCGRTDSDTNYVFYLGMAIVMGFSAPYQDAIVAKLFRQYKILADVDSSESDGNT